MNKEPAAITAAFAAIVDAVVLFADLGLDADAKGAIVVVITIIAGLFTRSQVSPAA